jgi:hypothetical protein
MLGARAEDRGKTRKVGDSVAHMLDALRPRA